MIPYYLWLLAPTLISLLSIGFAVVKFFVKKETTHDFLQRDISGGFFIILAVLLSIFSWAITLFLMGTSIFEFSGLG